MDDRTLISKELMAATLCGCGDLHAAGERLFHGEPEFRQAVQAQFLAIIGRIVLSGASAKLARELAAEIDHLVLFAGLCMKTAHQKLLDDLLPERETGAGDPIETASNPSAGTPQEGLKNEADDQ